MWASEFFFYEVKIVTYVVSSDELLLIFSFHIFVFLTSKPTILKFIGSQDFFLYLNLPYHLEGLSVWLSGKEAACQCKTCRRLWVQHFGREDALEEERATHSSILPRIKPRTEEPGELQSMGPWRIRHNWVTEHASPRKVTCTLQLLIYLLGV